MSGPSGDKDAINKLEIARKHLSTAHAHWVLYKEIYRSGNDSINVLNAVTGLGFGMIHDSLIDSVILHITRLLDKDGRTLSLRPMIRDLNDKIATKQLSKDLNDVADLVGVLKSHRDTRVAHVNQEVALDPTKLPALDVKMFEDSLKSLGELMNKFGEQLGVDSCIYEPITEPTGSAITLYLKLGLDANKLGRNALLGAISKDDLIEEIKKFA